MKKSHLILVSLVFLAPMLMAQDKLTAQTIPGRCGLVILTNDLPKVIDGLEKSGFGRMWRDPELQDFWEPMKKEMDFDKWDQELLGITGMTMDELRQIFTGPVAMGMTFDFDKMQEDADDAFKVIIAAHVAGKEGQARQVFEKMLQHEGDDGESDTYRDVTEEFKGETIHCHEKVTEENTELHTAWAITKGQLLLSMDKSLLQESMALVIDGDVSDSLVSQAAFKKMRMELGDSDLMLMVNIKPMLPGINSLFQKMAEEGTGAQMGINMAQIPTVLGLDALESLSISMSVKPNATLMDMGVFYSEKRGLLKLFAYGSGDYPRPRFIPDRAITVSTSRFSFPKMWAAAEEILNGLSPALLQMAGAQFQQFLQTAGVEEPVDLKKNLLNNLGDQLISFSLPLAESKQGKPQLTNPQVMAVSLADPSGFQVGLDELKLILTSMSKSNPQFGFTFDEKDYMNTKIHSVGMAGVEDFKVHYTVKEDYFMGSIGSYSALTEALLAMANPKRSIWDLPELKTALADVPKGSSGMTYVDFGEFIKTMQQQVEATQAQIAEQLEGETAPVEEMPDFSRLMGYFGPTVFGFYEKPGCMLIRGHINQPK